MDDGKVPGPIGGDIAYCPKDAKSDPEGDLRRKIEREFTYHAPSGTQPERYVKIRDKAKELAFVIAECVPMCADQTAAIRKLREAVMTANAGIAINEIPV